MIGSNKLLELGKDLVVKVAWDSLKAKGITLKKEELIDMAIANGVYIFFVKDMIMLKFKQNIQTELLAEFLAGLVAKSVLNILVKILRKREFTFTGIVISTAMSEGIGIGFEYLMGNMPTPANGNVRVA